MATKRLIHGVGINDADYVTQRFEKLPHKEGKRRQKLVWVCPFYRCWRAMLSRCYTSYGSNGRNRGCSVCEEWLLFSRFRSWMIKQDWEGKELDKDILIFNNKIYSPETCMFVLARVNSFVIECDSARSHVGVAGVTLTISGKYQVVVRQLNSERKFLGSFNTLLSAFQAWLNGKREVAKLLSAEQSDKRVAKALIAYYDNYPTPEIIYEKQNVVP